MIHQSKHKLGKHSFYQTQLTGLVDALHIIQNKNIVVIKHSSLGIISLIGY